MKYTLFLLIALFIFIGCSENPKTDNTEVKPESGETLLSEKNLPVQIFKLDINADNSLITNSGVIVQIPKGSLTSDKNPVELEIQEALSMKDIFMAGLQTRSNGEALSSGGMIYINAKQGYNVTIKEKLKMFVPTQNYNPDMQVYDGVKDSTGNINWINPAPLPETKTTKRISHGEQLYMSNCASCHAVVYKDGTGPALYNVQNRRPKKWLYDFTRNSAKLISDHNVRSESLGGDSVAFIRYDYYAKCIFNKWSKIAMTPFPKLSDKDLEDLYTYIKLESDKRPELASKFKNNCCDSCETYKKATQLEEQKLYKLYEEQSKLFSLQQSIALNKEKLMAKQSNAVIFENNSDSTNRPAIISQTPVIASRIEDVSPELYTGVYYELEIKTFGWKNIDILIAGQDGVVNSMLWVRVAESSTYKMRVQLLIPSRQISLAGGRVEGDRFSFKTKDGNIDLPQGVKCFIIAMSEKEDQLYFDMKEFTSSVQQTIEMAIQKKSAEEINTALNGLNMQGLTSKIKEKEHIQEIRKMEKDISQIQNSIRKNANIQDAIMNNLKKFDHLKPKNCECDDFFLRNERSISDTSFQEPQPAAVTPVPGTPGRTLTEAKGKRM